MPKLFVLRDYNAESGLHPADLLVEVSTVTFAAATTVTVPTAFANGQIVNVLVTMNDDTPTSALTFGTTAVVTTGTITITASASNSKAVWVVVIGKPTI